MITAVLLGVVAVTLLTPQEQNGLFGVNVPGGSDEIVPEPPSSEPRADEGGQPSGDQGVGGNSAETAPALALTGPAAPGAGALAAGAGGAVPPAEPPPPAEEDDEGDDGAPPGEQYGDTLARLNDALD